MAAPQAHIELLRDCAAVQVPYGNAVTLRAGTKVRVTQALGDTYTLQTAHGYMVRIEGKDADAIGETPGARTAAAASAAPKRLDVPVEQAQLWDVMRLVYDPEIPVNIVDLGLIYQCKTIPAGEGEQGIRVEVEMTLTAPGCGMGDVLQEDVRRKISALDGVREVHVSLVLDPPWAADMMSESARLELGVF